MADIEGSAARTWVPFTDADQAQPGRRMRGWHENPSEAWIVVDRRGPSSNAAATLDPSKAGIIAFTNGRWIGVFAAKAEGWEIEV